MAENRLVVDLPLEGRFRKFLLKKYGVDGEVRLTRKNPEGLFLSTLLKLPNRGNPLFGSKGKFQIVLTDPEHRRKMVVTDKSAKDFSDYMDGIIRQEFLHEVFTENRITGKHVDKLIRDFKVFYEFDETDWSFDAMKRYFYRNSDKMKRTRLAA